MTDDATPGAPLAVVGIGCSAGGLDALERFFRSLPADSPFAVVVVQHLDPSHESLLPELLRKVTAMPLAAASEGGQLALQAGHAYIIPPGYEMTLEAEGLCLREPAEPRGHRMLIDVFFRSLAARAGVNATAVILSGGGSDGSLGLCSVKEHGGLVVAQEPGTAEHPAMPASAIATGMVDMVLPPEEIASSILAYHANRQAETELAQNPAENVASDRNLARMARILKARGGQDFRHYKAGSFARRVARRMAINGLSGVDAYIELLEQQNGEAEALGQDVLIGVTQFFRDRKVFDTLVRDVLAPHFAGPAAEGQTLRIWVPGCSTGEEAYTLAILLEELRKPGMAPVRYKIFATDIDDRAIEKAREGAYAESIVEDVPAPYLQRYFFHDRERASYHVKRALRDHIVFAPHNIFQDPPYSRLDLVSCRNVLIYLDTEVQQSALEAFSYALRSGGFLLLGSAERLGHAERWFETVDGRCRLYRRQDGAMPGRQLPGLEHRVSTNVPAAVTALATRAGRSSAQGLVEQRLLDDGTRTCMAVDSQGDLLYVHGSAGKYLDIRTGRARNNVLINARKGLELPLVAAFRRLRKGENRVSLQGLSIQTDGDVRHADLSLERVVIDGSDQETILVMLTEIREPSALPPAGVEDPATMDPVYGATLERELRATREHLQSIIEELETTNEELKSTNEEFQSANEELQSTNEELKTSKEELQSINEELLSVNAELEHKLRLLMEANSDIQHLLESTHAGVIFLDASLCLRRYTEAVRKIVDLIPVDVGRPIGHFAANIAGFDLHAFATQVLEARSPQECEVRLKGATMPTHLLRGQPYLGEGDGQGGVVLTFIDIEALSLARQDLEDRVVARTVELEEARREAEAASRAKTEFLSNMSHELRTPLNGIIGFSELARDRVKDPELKQWLATVVRSGLHLNRLVDDILDISRIEREAITLAPKTVSLDGLVKAVCELVRPDAEAQGLTFRLELPPALASATLLLDANRVSQILLNLLTNAVKHTREGTVSLAITSPERTSGRLRLRFVVSDTGIGIAQEDQARIFTMFEQTDNSLTRETGGSGLGLAIALRLAEAMNGTLSLQSEPGEGSAFTFEAAFPLVAPAPATARALDVLVEDLRSQCRGWRALVVDDDPASLELGRLFLASLGMAVDLAADGRECLELAAKTHYDLVLMDWQMPVLDGLAATARLRAMNGYESTPVLAVTARAFEEDRAACLAAGVGGYLAKPLDATALYRELYDCLVTEG
ncbi:CheR family methyltransferase [Pseudohaliea rubra]|uniref:Chemotaxis protein methyltransferase CheR n=1 Tax=Pseudohaliea rubra DSM 19751 TaxID=1265313 RepID=A0A095VSG8_9GAMM|nr:CheR family methyltransferase [Pseudohaliea rubra]KGE04412.1 Chemotaxis protein methyltransferase CheR [Pseudohaliea rubra DSM 19751]